MPLFEIGKCKAPPQDYRMVRIDRLIEKRIPTICPEFDQDYKKYARTAGNKTLLLESLKKYDRETMKGKDMSYKDQKLLNQAINLARKHFILPTKVERLDWRDVLQHLDKATSSGYPHYKKKGMILETILDEGHLLGHWMKRHEFNDIVFPYAVAYKRSHLSQVEEPKLRLIWGIPAAMHLVEGLFAQRLIEMYGMYLPTICFQGHFATRIINAVSSFKKDYVLYNLDWSAFDASISPRLIYAAFDILHENIDFDHWDGIKNSTEMKEKWERLWTNMVKYFINTPIIGPNGVTYRKTHGIPSGSWFTQLVGSIVNWICIKFMLLKVLEEKFEDYLSIVADIDIYVLGDDSLFGLRKSIACHVTLDHLSVIARDVLKMKLNPSKCMVGQGHEVKFLGFRVVNGHLHRDELDYLLMMLYPESNDIGIQHTITRVLGIHIVSGGYSDVVTKMFQDLIGLYGLQLELERSRHMLRRFKVIYDFDFTNDFNSNVLSPYWIFNIS